MNIRLQEVELGTSNPKKSKDFYNSIIGLKTNVDQEALNVFNSGIAGIDFNTSTHLAPNTIVASFLTDNLQEIIERLEGYGVLYTGPLKSHLGMISIQFNDPDGYLVKVNQPTDESPAWLKV